MASDPDRALGQTRAEIGEVMGAGHAGRIFGGVETGGTKCVCALGTDSGELLARAEFATVDPARTIGEVVRFFRERPVPEAIGVGSFGPVELDPASASWGCVTTTPKSGWRYASVAPAIASALGVPVAFDTDVGAAAYGEHTWGAGRGLASVVYLTVGTGIGAGVVLGDQVWHGMLGPEVGHVRIPRACDDAYAGCCPFHGDCWEGLASGQALAGRLGCPADELPDDDPVWELETGYLAAGILAITLTLSPHRVIVGGGVGGRPGLLERVRQQLRELVGDYHEALLLGEQIGAYLVAPALGADAGVLGAIALARDLDAG